MRSCITRQRVHGSQSIIYFCIDDLNIVNVTEAFFLKLRIALYMAVLDVLVFSLESLAKFILLCCGTVDRSDGRSWLKNTHALLYLISNISIASVVFLADSFDFLV